MTRRTTVTMVVASLVAAVVCWLSIRDPQPRYKGRSLGYWLEMYGSGGDQAQAEQAIQGIGTNAFPLLLRWIREPDPERHALVRRVGEMMPNLLRPRWAREGYVSRSYSAACAFHALRTQAHLVIPELSAIGADRTNPEAASYALSALRYVGSNGVPALLSAVRNPSHPYREGATFVLGYHRDLGPYSNSVVAELIAQLDDPAVGTWAASALGFLKAQPEVVVPALAQYLERTNTTATSRVSVATSLAWFGREAAPALPHLTNALNDPDPIVRQNVAGAIKQIHYRMREK